MEAKIETWRGIKLNPLTQKLAEKYSKEHNVAPEELLNRAFEEFFHEDLKRIGQETIEALPHEDLIIQVPKAVMDFLRASERMYEMTPKEWVENTVVDNIEAELETCEGPFGNYWDLIERFKLEPVFKVYGTSLDTSRRR
jgi:hypothetical protein